MGIFIVLLIFGIVFVVNVWIECVDEFITGALVIIVSAMAAFILSLLSFIPTMCASNVDMLYEKESTTEIVALKDNGGIEGHFYLMGGYVDDELKYYYAEQTEMGVTVKKVDAEDSFITYTDGTPYIEKYEAKKLAHWYDYLWAYPMDTYYKIYVPAGTVTTEYEIDLE